MMARGRLLAYGPAAGVVLVGVLLSAYTFSRLREGDAQSADIAFGDEGKIHVGAIDKVLSRQVNAVRWLAALFSKAPPAAEARDTLPELGLRLSDVDNLSIFWASYTPAEDGDEPMDGVLTVSATDEGTYAEHWRTADLEEDTQFTRYASLAHSTGRTYIVPRCRIAESGMGETAITILSPVFRTESPVQDEAQSSFAGVVCGVFHLSDVVEEALPAEIDEIINLTIIDSYANPGERLIYAHHPEAWSTGAPPLLDESISRFDGIHYVGAIELAGTRRWLIGCTPTQAYLATTYTWRPFLGLFLGLSLTVLVAGQLVSQVRHRRQAEALVRLRTAELQRTNDRLSEEIAERKRYESEREELLGLLERSNETLRDVNGQLQQSNSDLQAFAVVTSHDLKEPLRKVQVLTDGLRRSLESSTRDGAGEYIDLIVEGTRRMGGLIDSILSVSRIATHGAAFAETDLGDVLREAVEDIRVRLEESGGRVEAGELPTIQCDRTQVRRLFQNLLENSLKYRKDDVPPHIVVVGEALGDEGMIEITFQDNGIGIAHDVQGRIFGLFQQGQPNGAAHGLGVGLAVCRKIVERHEGTIAVESMVGEGTRFRIRLPIAHDTPSHELV